MGHKQLVPNFGKMDEWQKSNGGIDIKKQEVGTQIIVKTQNNDYRITVLDPKDGKLHVQGGRWEEPIEIFFNGSTWGGSMLKLRWIGYGMKMEFAHPEKPAYVIHTSFVVEAKIVGQNWEYEMDWPDEIKRSKAALAQPNS